MKIAVTYENGEVFQHFGHTEQFKVYEVEEGKVVSSEIISSGGTGHGALAGLLADGGIDVLICGGLGGGAQEALIQNGIQVCAGAEGNADEAVESFLRGELVNSGANCDHHGEGHSCGNHDGGGCGNECRTEPLIQGKNAGKRVRTHYRGTFNDGTQFDSSYDRGEPLEFICGVGMMIPGFDKAVADMEVGEKKQVHLMPSEAYGEADPQNVFSIEIAMVAGAKDLEVGQQVYLQAANGQPVLANVIEKDDRTITFDMNNEMAGKELNFLIELLEVMDAE